MSARWYAVVDGARDDALHQLAQRSRSHACLFSGALNPALAAAAPYLAAIDEDEPLIHEWRARGGGRRWGLLCESALGLDALRKHLREFLQAKLPDGTVALFRFYDPGVFATYMQTAAAAERAPWFAGVSRYVAEVAADVTHDFRWRGGVVYDGEVALA